VRAVGELRAKSWQHNQIARANIRERGVILDPSDNHSYLRVTPGGITLNVQTIR